MQQQQITGELLYTAFHASMPLAGDFPPWEAIEDWRQEIYDRFAVLVTEELSKDNRSIRLKGDYAEQNHRDTRL